MDTCKTDLIRNCIRNAVRSENFDDKLELLDRAFNYYVRESKRKKIPLSDDPVRDVLDELNKMILTDKITFQSKMIYCIPNKRK